MALRKARGICGTILFVSSLFSGHLAFSQEEHCPLAAPILGRLKSRRYQGTNTSEATAENPIPRPENVLEAYLNLLDPYHLLFSLDQVEAIKKTSVLGEGTFYLDILRGQCSFLHSSRSIFKKKHHELTQTLYFANPLKERVLTLAADRRFKNLVKIKPNNWPKDQNEKEQRIVEALAYRIQIYLNKGLSEEGAFDLAVHLLIENYESIEQKLNNDLEYYFINALASQQDPYFQRYDREEYEQLLKDHYGRSDPTTGLVFEEWERGLPRIKQITDLAPKDSNLEVGDLLVAINGEKVKEFDYSGSLALIKRLSFLKLRVEFAKPDGRRYFSDLQYHSGLKPGEDENHLLIKPFPHEGRTFVVIQLSHFFGGADDSIKSKLRRLLQISPVDGILLDLRNNPGGGLVTSENIAALFLKPASPILAVCDTSPCKYGRIVMSWPYESNQFRVPLVVLVNENSASASEVLAGTLKDNARALIVGTPRTYGKGAIQTIDTGTFRVKYTSGQYFTPSGISPEGRGVTSDIVISAPHPGAIYSGDIKKHLPALSLEEFKQKTEQYDRISISDAIPYLVERSHQRTGGQLLVNEAEQFMEALSVLSDWTSLHENSKNQLAAGEP